ncbi:MAG: anaerobic ribonucleoside-triphosphate reductase activating protein [Campylobacterales bacterium]
MPNPAASKAEVYDLTPFTLLDFPDVPAAILWFAGCNLRCPYCYNPHIVEGRGRLNLGDVLAFLNKRIGLLEGVVLSGGEPTLCKNLIGYAEEIKKLGFKIKLDTNATRPFTVKTLLEQKLLDYVALDFKAPQNGWGKTTGREAAGYDAFLQTLQTVQNSGVAYEVRTTFHPALLGVADLQSMIDTLRHTGYDRPLYVQHYRHGSTLGNLPDAPRIELDFSKNIAQR